MSTITELFASVWRNYATDGEPESGVHEPVKSAIRGVGAAIDAQKAEGVADLAAIKALTSRPALVFVKSLEGFFVWNAGSSTTPDDETVIQCTSGDAGRYLLWVPANPNPVPVLSGHIDGLTWSKNGSNTIDIAAGVAVATDGETVISYDGDTALDLATLFGDGGLLDTGTVANTNYELYILRNPGTEDVRPLAVVEGAAPTLPSGYTQYRKFGWVKRSAGSIVGFKTYLTAGGGIAFEWSSPTVDVSLADTLTTSRRTDAIKVPLAFSVFATINVEIYDPTTTLAVDIYCPDRSDMTVAISSGVAGSAPLSTLAIVTAGNSQVRTQQRVRTSAAGLIAAEANTTVNIYQVATIGFEWSRR